MKTKTINHLSEHEKKQLFDVINQDTSMYGIRNRAIFYLAKYCALRASEIGIIRIDDFQKAGSQLYCKRLKGSYNNTLRIIDPVVLHALLDYLSIRVSLKFNSPYMFLSQRGTPISRKTLDYLMKTYCSYTHIPQDKRHFHVLRHTRAIELADEHINLQDIQWWLGHVNIANTMIYLQFTTTQQEHLYQLLSKNRRKIL